MAAPKIHFIPALAPAEWPVSEAAPEICFNPTPAPEWSVAMAAPEIRPIPVPVPEWSVLAVENGQFLPWLLPKSISFQRPPLNGRLPWLLPKSVSFQCPSS
jgi:hypothetical protein